jgi:hypothetical protein
MQRRGATPMIKVQDIVYVAHRAPDLELHAQFLRDFGMKTFFPKTVYLKIHKCSTFKISVSTLHPSFHSCCMEENISTCFPEIVQSLNLSFE